MTKPRYDRILPLISLVVLGLMVVFLLEGSPDNPLVARLGGDLPVISVAWIVIAMLAVVISTGADLLARSHPQLEHSTMFTLPGRLSRVEFAPLFWILPSGVLFASFAFFRLFRGTLQGGAFILVLLTSGGLLTATLVAQHHSLNRDGETRERAKVALQAITYVVAFGLFSAIMYGGFRVLYTMPLVFVVAVPLAYRSIVRQINDRGRPLVISTSVVGVVMAQASAVLGYWGAPFLIRGTLLLAVFYVLVGLLQHAQNNTLDRRISWELGGLGALVLGVLAAATLW
ncbi:MAG TPA: hypothetical protein VGE07_11985 [Herpetosiphonaceae bacterium]